MVFVIIVQDSYFLPSTQNIARGTDTFILFNFSFCTSVRAKEKQKKRHYTYLPLSSTNGSTVNIVINEFELLPTWITRSGSL